MHCFSEKAGRRRGYADEVCELTKNSHLPNSTCGFAETASSTKDILILPCNFSPIDAKLFPGMNVCASLG